MNTEPVAFTDSVPTTLFPCKEFNGEPVSWKHGSAHTSVAVMRVLDTTCGTEFGTATTSFCRPTVGASVQPCGGNRAETDSAAPLVNARSALS